MEKLILVWFLLASLSCSLKAQGLSSVEWGKPITFKDFESAPGEKDTAAANISVTILLGYSSGRDGRLNFKVAAVMDKDESWIREEFKNSHAVLKHEQGHFDIAHIYAKKLEAGLRDKRYTKKDVKALHEIYDRFLEKMHELQLQYDRETRGGMDPLAQSKWRRFIHRELGLVE